MILLRYNVKALLAESNPPKRRPRSPMRIKFNTFASFVPLGPLLIKWSTDAKKVAPCTVTFVISDARIASWVHRLWGSQTRVTDTTFCLGLVAHSWSVSSWCYDSMLTVLKFGSRGYEHY